MAGSYTDPAIWELMYLGKTREQAIAMPPAASLPEDQIGASHELIYRPLRNPDGPPQAQVEYKLRRFVNDYLAPPKTQARLDIALETFGRMATEIARMGPGHRTS